MIFLMKYWRQISIAILFIAIISSLYAYGIQKYNQGFDKCVSLQDKKMVNDSIERNKKDAEIIRLSDPDLDDRLSRWMRD